MTILEEGHILREQMIEKLRLHIGDDAVAGAGEQNEIAIGGNAANEKKAGDRQREKFERGKPVRLHHMVEYGLQEIGGKCGCRGRHPP